MDFITTILFIIIAATAVIFLVRKKVIHIMSRGIKVLFVIFLAVGLISLFAPQIYNTLADGTLKNIGTYKTITDIDNSISLDSIKDVPQNIWESIKNIFEPQDSSNQQNQKPSTSTESKGLLEGSLYTGLVALLGFIYRVLGIALSIGGLILITYLSYSMAGATDMDDLKSRYALLEKRVAELESRT